MVANLSDERKFIVNKDLFSNPFINPFKKITTQMIAEERQPPLLTTHGQIDMVQKNPLNSNESLAIQQRSLSEENSNQEEVKVKSLF